MVKSPSDGFVVGSVSGVDEADGFGVGGGEGG